MRVFFLFTLLDELSTPVDKENPEPVLEPVVKRFQGTDDMLKGGHVKNLRRDIVYSIAMQCTCGQRQNKIDTVQTWVKEDRIVFEQLFFHKYSTFQIRNGQDSENSTKYAAI